METPPMMRFAIRGVAAALVTFCALPALGQLNSDTVPTARTVPLREAVEAQLETSRWHFGPLRVHPELKLDNLGYNDNVFGVSDDAEKVDDYSATIGLGIRSIAPLGSNTYLRVDAIPEYTWYKELDERRDFGYEVGGAVLALFNRMSIEGGARSTDTVTYVSSEDATPIPERIDKVYGKIEIEAVRRLHLFAGYETQTVEYEPQESDINFGLLNRDETAARAGIRYEFRPRFSILAMFEETDAEFPDDPVFSENQGDALLAGFTYERETLYVNAVAGNRTIEYEGLGGAATFDDVTGSLFASWNFARRSELEVTVSQTPRYSYAVGNPYFLESREGVRLVVPMGRRFVAFGGVRAGKNEYPLPVLIDGELLERTDDVTGWEAGIGIRVLESAVFRFSTRLEDFDSNIAGFDRKYVSTGFNLSINGVFDR
ncbi:MAG: hypothetical protein NDJ92_16575 [Thermoanaerobaculia bacterium]|nr:hypothetical protein [Thermoanaerobaculia bacterium]